MSIANVRRKAILFAATGALIGYSPVAPGTFGSLAALPLCLWIASLNVRLAGAVVIALVLVSTWIAHAAERMLANKDPKQVVIDEICGMTVAMLALPFTPVSVFWGFALFRGFDILKPFPINWVDKRVSGGVGIMLDDVIAGIFANVLLRMGLLLFK